MNHGSFSTTLQAYAWANADPGPGLNIKTVSSRYGDSHVEGKTVGRLSYL